jgi:hypothetical protein
VAADDAAQARAKEAKRLFKLKLDGQEKEYDEDYVIAQAQKGIVSDKRFSEAAKLRKEAAQERAVFDRARKDGSLEEVLEMMGPERFHKLSEDYWRDLLNEQDMSPQEKALRQREKELQKRERQLKQSDEQKQQAMTQQLEDHYTKQFDKDITEALTASKLPKSAYTVKRMAELMQENLRLGLDLPAKTVSKILEEEARSSVVSLLGEMDEDALGGLLGEGIAAKLRAHELRKVRGGGAPGRAPGAKPAAAKPRAQRQEFRQGDWLLRRLEGKDGTNQGRKGITNAIQIRGNPCHADRVCVRV